jgi:Large polyvalent protein associated domain 38/Large polyvalent protein-associated domain 5/Large polyvalent protein-associated domain 1
MPLKEFSGQLDQPKLKEFTGKLDRETSSPDASWSDNLRDVAAAGLKIGPTIVKGVADLGNMLTGDTIDLGVSKRMSKGMKAIDEVIGSDALNAQKANINQALQDPNVGITNLPGIVLQNPRAAVDTAISTVGSMFLPAGAAAGTVKMLPTIAKLFPRMASVTPGAAATGASVVTGAAQNAAETFADTEGQALGDRYKGAGISGAASLALGKLLGGGAEGVIARRLAGESVGRGVIEAGKSAVKTGAKEFLQEGGEESANYVGKQTAKNEAIDLNAMGKQGLYGGMIGLAVGAGSDVATNAADIGKGGIERQVARAIDQAAQDIADRQTPQVIQQTVARIFDQMPKRQEAAPAPQPDPQPLALGFDPAVRNPQPTMQVDPLGNASPMPSDQQAAIQAEVERMNNLGLTPDVQRAAAQRAQSPEPGPVSPPSDLIQRLMGTGWQPTAISSQGVNPAPEPGLVSAIGKDLEQQFQQSLKEEIRARLASQAKPETQPQPASAQAPALTAQSAAPVTQPATSGMPEAGAGGTQPPQAAPKERYGIDNTGFSEGGKPFKTKRAAQDARKLQPMMRVVSVPGGFALAEKTPAQLAAEAKAAKRIRGASTGNAGVPMAAHEFIAAEGGLSRSAQADLGIEGNVKIGNRWLYAGIGKGLSIEQAAQKLKEAGYTNDELHNSAYDIIRRSISEPQYTAEGWEQVGQAQQEAQFEDYLAAQQEAAQAKDFDPFDPLADAGFLEDDSDGTGFWEADPELQAEVSALAAQLEAIGIDKDEILDPIIRANPKATQDQYNEIAKQALSEAIAKAAQPRSNRDSGQDDGEQGQARGQTESKSEEGLTSYTPQEIEDRLAKLEQAEKERQQQEREAEQRARADAQRDDFALTGSDRPADVAASRGQKDIFSSPPASQDAQAPMPTPGMTPAQAVANAFIKEGSTESDGKAMAKRIQQLADRLDNPITLWWNPEDGELAAQSSDPFDGNGVAITTVEPTPDPRMPAKPTGKIEDFGEKIGGARKDVWTSFQDDLGAVADDDIANQPLSKIWPQPDYQALLDGGASPWAVAFAHAARDEIPANKPRQSWKLKQWADQVRLLRETTMKLMDGRLDVERAKQLMTQFTSKGMRDVAGRVELYMLVGHRQSLSGVRLSSGEYSIHNGIEYKPAKVIWSVEKEAAATAFSNWPRQLATGFTKEEALKAFKERYDSLDINPAAKKKETSFEIYSRRDSKGYWVGKKVGRNPIFLAGPFDNIKAARDYRFNNQAELVAKLEKSKEIPRERRDSNEPRVGEDMRNGQDVTPQMFGETFGFRGVEFGNWVEQGRRQKDLNDAFDALMDMAAIIGVPPKALSLNGELGLAFGARGGGGVNPAAAHYEPGKVVINLTKKSGAGSLGHEWWHALDNYFSRMRAKGDGMMTDAMDVSLASRGSNFVHQGAVRKEMIEAFGAVMKSIRETAIKARSAKLDAKRSKEYWTTDPEMSARAFESYLISKLQDQDASNDYLANIVSPETWKAAEAIGFELDDSYPYPTAGEIPAIRAGFDHFFQTIETRETERGIALFRAPEQADGDGVRLYGPARAGASKPGNMSLDAVRKAAKTAIKGVPDAPGIEVFADPAAAGITVAPGVRPMGGTLPDGRILLFADNIGSVIDVHQTVFHELFHRGAKVRFTRNADYIAAMLDLAAGDATVRRLAATWKKSADGQDKRSMYEERGALTGDRLANYEALAVEEALAEIAENLAAGTDKPAPTTIQRIAQALARVAEVFGMARLAKWLREANASAAERFVMETVRMSGGTPNQNTTAVLFSQGVASASEPWTVTEPGTGDAFIRAIQNNKIDVKRVRDAIAERYGKVAESKDAYLGEELYHGRVAARVSRIYDEQVEPLLKKIAVAGKNVGVTMDDVNLYLHARHAPERNAAMKAINPDMENNEALSGLSNQEAAKVLADFRAAGKDNALALIAADVDQLLADTRTNLVADGLEDAGVVAAWEAAYKHYVPLQRDIKSTGTPKGMGFSIRGPESKRAVGSNREVVNILANVVAQAETAAIRAEKAVVGRTLLAMARQYPNPDFWKVDIAPTKPRIDKETGLVLRNAVDPLFQTADNVLMVKDYGQEHFIVFNQNNERAMAMAKAMKNLDIAPMNKILEVANKGTRFLASLLTQRNPLFWLTNFARDIQGALINLEGTDAEGLQREAMANLPKAFKGMHAIVRGEGSGQWARYAREFQEAGGTTGYMQVFENSDKRMADLEKEVARMQQGKADPRRLARLALEFVDDYNDIIENAVRLSVFQAARDANVSTAKAASIAKNITVNFNRKGNLTPPINALYMFFNASVQGTARLAQAMVTSRKAQALVGGIAVMGFVLDALNRMAAGDDDETKRNRYDLIPEFEKSRNWIFMNPMRPGEYVKVPLPLGPHVFHNAGRLLSDAAFRKNLRNASEYGWSIAGVFLDAFSPLGASPSLGQLIAPSVLDPALQVAENKSFTGAPVYKSADRGFGKTDPKPAYTRHFESTPDVWIGASKLLSDATGGDAVKPGAIDINPDILKHVFYTMTGGPGRTLDQAIDTAQGGGRGREFSVNRLPLASRFYGANDDAQRERAYYDDRKRVLDAKQTFDYYMKNGRAEEARKVAAELGDGDPAKGRKKMLEFSAAEKSVRKINGSIRQELERDDDGEAKAEQLRALRQRRVRVMSNALDDE